MDFQLPESNAGTAEPDGSDQEFQKRTAEAKARRETERAEAARLEADRQAKLANSPVEIGKRKVAESKTAARAEQRKRTAAWRQKHLPVKLKEAQGQALTALPEVERQSLLDQQAECLRLVAEMVSCMRDVAKGRIAGLEPVDHPNAMAWPDQLYREVKTFVEAHGLTKNWAPDVIFLTRLESEDFDNFDDQTFVKYGLRTRILDGQFFEFLRYVDRWCQSHTDEADSDIAAEVRALTQSHDNTPSVTQSKPQTYSQLALDRKRDSLSEGEKILADFHAEWSRNYMKEMNKIRGMEISNEQPSV